MTRIDDNAIEKRKRIFAIISASSGNLVEWFDFYVYAFSAIYFAHAFFPQGDSTVQLLKTAGIFAIGFLMRPIGGFIFGRIADRQGRRQAMMMSVAIMCAGSLMIACLPTYEQIGMWAPLLLLVARMLQGLSVGGEYGTSATYMSEVALEGQRGFYASFQYVTLIGGQLLAVMTVVILQNVLSDESLHQWGWRLPFIVGAIAAVISLFMRRSLSETAATDEGGPKEEAGSLALLFGQHRRAFWTCLGFTAGGSLMFYTFTTYMQKYLVNSAKFSTQTASWIMTCALVLFMLLQPLLGSLSDRIGLRSMMLIFASAGTLFTVPLLVGLGHAHHPVMAFLLLAIALTIVGFYTSISGLIKSAMFPAEVRALGVGLSYAIANAVFGGSAEFVALSFKSVGLESAFYVYVCAFCLLAFVVCWCMKGVRQNYLHQSA